jgi:DNA-binding transcriptional MerR regulator
VHFTAVQAARLAGCSVTQVRHWARTGLVVPATADGYGFRDLVALRVVASLLDAGLPLAKVRAARAGLAADAGDLAGLRLVTDGSTVWACRDDGEILDALRGGQLALFVPVDRFAEQVDADVRAFAAERDRFVETLVEPDAPDRPEQAST